MPLNELEPKHLVLTQEEAEKADVFFKDPKKFFKTKGVNPLGLLINIQNINILKTVIKSDLSTVV